MLVYMYCQFIVGNRFSFSTPPEIIRMKKNSRYPPYSRMDIIKLFIIKLLLCFLVLYTNMFTFVKKKLFIYKKKFVS